MSTKVNLDDLLRESSRLRTSYIRMQRMPFAAGLPHNIAVLLGTNTCPPVLAYVWPRDRPLIASTYWTLAQAARQWGWSYQSTRRWLWGNLSCAYILALRMPDGSIRHKLVMLAGQVRTVHSSGMPGNPLWFDPDYQAAQATRRWSRQRLTQQQPEDAPPWD